MLSNAIMSSRTQSRQGPREIFDLLHHVVHIVLEDRTRVYTLTTLRRICFPIKVKLENADQRGSVSYGVWLE